MKFRRWLLRWAFWFAILLSADVYKKVVRGRPLTAETVVENIVFAAVGSWLFALPGDAQCIGFLSYTAALVLSFGAYFKLSKSVHLSPLADAVATYAAEYLPFLISVGVVLLWLRRKGSTQQKASPLLETKSEIENRR